MPSLVAENGPLAGQRLKIERELTIGRVDADVVIEDAKLSRRHVVFRIVDRTLEVEDLNSTNGTFVDERRIDRPTRLDDGAHVTLGSSRFVAEIEVAVDETQVGERPADHQGHRSDATALGETVLHGNRPAAPGETMPRSEATPPGETVLQRPARAPAASPTPATFGAFAPRTVRRGGLATRSWIPVALSYGSVIAVAVALVLYFATR